MPSSILEPCPWVIARARTMGLRSILDVGTGYGRWGALLREYLDVWDFNYNRATWTRVIDGIEINPEMLGPNRGHYDAVWYEDARTRTKSLRDDETTYDAVLCSDVLEHLEKPDGTELLANMAALAENYLILSTPVGDWLGNAHGENESDKHLSIWEVKDFMVPGKETKYVSAPLLLDAGLTLADLARWDTPSGRVLSVIYKRGA